MKLYALIFCALNLSLLAMQELGNVSQSKDTLDDIGRVDLSHSDLTSLRWQELAILPRVHTLDLSHNMLTAFEGPYPAHLSMLSCLMASYNCLTSESLRPLAMLTTLRTLDLSNNPTLHYIPLTLLGSLTRLRSLNLENTAVPEFERQAVTQCLERRRIVPPPLACAAFLPEQGSWIKWVRAFFLG